MRISCARRRSLRRLSVAAAGGLALAGLLALAGCLAKAGPSAAAAPRATHAASPRTGAAPARPPTRTKAAPGKAGPSHASSAARSSDWTIPARYRGKAIRRRVRFFPEKILALTFDDGPDKVNTPRVLKTLAEYGAHATFFVIGRRAKMYPELVRAEAAAGNCVGNHSFTHPASTTPTTAKQELQRTAAVIKAATGRAPTCFRPPYGIVHGTLCREALHEGYAAILWTISSADTRPISPQVIANNVIHTPNPGDIILMHDGAGHARTVEALPIVLKQLTAAGYRFVTIPQLLRAWDRWLATSPKAAKAGGKRPDHRSAPAAG